MGWNLNQVGAREARILKECFSEAKAHKAVMKLGKDKAPRPDSFTIAFWASIGSW